MTRLFRADQSTPLSRTDVVTAVGTAVTAPTRYRIEEDVWAERDYTPQARTAGETVGWRLAIPAGTEVTQAEVDAMFDPPTISGVTPATGPLAGGTAITVNGTEFTPGSTVTVGGAAATAVTFVNDREIRCTTPAGTAGPKDVVVTTSYGPVTAADAFTYA